MELLYSQALLLQYQAKKKRCLYGICALCCVCAAVCVYLCTLVRTGNADALLFCVTALSAVTGWAVILLLAFLYAPCRAQCGHIAGILESDTEEYTGEMHFSGEKVHIPRSIDICKVALAEDGETKYFHIDAVLLNALPADGTKVRIRAARKYITAYEVIA